MHCQSNISIIPVMVIVKHSYVSCVRFQTTLQGAGDAVSVRDLQRQIIVLQMQEEDCGLKIYLEGEVSVFPVHRLEAQVIIKIVIPQKHKCF